MRSLAYHRYGNPEQVLQLDQVNDPPAPGPDEVLVRVLSRPVHPGDLLGVAGRYRAPGDTAAVPIGGVRVGFEGMGTIAAVGSAVQAEGRLAPGMRVAFFPGRGAWSERAIVAAQFVTPLPDDVPDERGAQLHVNPLTAQMLLRAAYRAGVGTGETQGAMVLTAAGSSVAKMVAALALEEGLPVIGLVRGSAGAAELAHLLPGLPVVATDTPDWRERLERLLEGRPLRTVFDAIGGDLPSELFLRLAPGGTLVTYGDMSGEPLRIPALMLPMRDLHIEGVSVGRWAALPPAQRQQDLQGALYLARRHPALFEVAGSYDLAAVAEAVRHAGRPGKRGAVLLTSFDAAASKHAAA
ncbi:zinc-binding dehydrogenase [Massilia sp. TN1-12]|uniref:zinc-binding dehydrogenase n=1 Tax=Massilia paldalensis TaxID=3377675 RepID=UPI00384B5014